MTEKSCHFIIPEQYRPCGNRCALMSPFCEEHKGFYAEYDNQTLLDLMAQSIRDCTTVGEDKKIRPTASDEAWASFTNLGNELTARGYSQKEWGKAASRRIDQLGLFNDIYKAIGRDPKWKKFERVLEGIHRLKAQGAKVELDDKILGKRSGSMRQIDISIRFDQGFYDYLTIVECKDYDRKVSIDRVEAFRTVIEDVGAQKGIMVSPKGFQEGAVEVAKAYEIELYTLTEQMSDWTKHVREQVIKFPWIVDFEFDHDVVSRKSPNKGKVVRIMFRDFWLYDQSHRPIEPLAQTLSKIIKDFMDSGVAMPCRVTAQFDPPFLAKFPNEDWFTPVNAIKVTLVEHRLTRTTEVDQPPSLQSYVYQDMLKGKRFEISPDDLPHD